MSTNPGRSVRRSAFLAVSVSAEGPVTKIAVAGELDASTAASLADAVACAVRDPGAERVRFHLAHLTFLDSAGIRCLLECRTTAEAAGRPIELTDPSAEVLDVLAITGLLEVFGLADRLPGLPSGLRPSAGRRPGRYQPKEHGQVVAEAVAIRQAARETRKWAERTSLSRSLPVPPGAQLARRSGEPSSPL